MKQELAGGAFWESFASVRNIGGQGESSCISETGWGWNGLNSNLIGLNNRCHI